MANQGFEQKHERIELVAQTCGQYFFKLENFLLNLSDLLFQGVHLLPGPLGVGRLHLAY